MLQNYSNQATLVIFFSIISLVSEYIFTVWVGNFLPYNRIT